ncbi:MULTISPECIES: ABC transporter permease [Clostridia]|uniref:ABC transporter permease n=1 Tax=Clostridia TaxID=186801 RepID=UPI000EA2C974|nr:MULTISPECIES: ABC transporter permease [Clostridia]NBJ68962.1 ABC transporter permease [Roseburia sp. 1XD42-34]RKI79865.1 ABC transporter permease [Clostridium sp. 1xD42-85]
MKALIHTRFLHWKQAPFHLIFWLLFPIIVVIFLQYLLLNFEEDTKVPVGIVVADQTNTAFELVEKIKESPLIRVYQLDEKKALNQLEKHELDSVFVIKEGYEEQINRGIRNRLITSYQSDLSFAYTSVSEMVASMVQQDTGRIKTAFTVLQMEEQLANKQNWKPEEIIATSKEIESEQNLLSAHFRYQGQADVGKSQSQLWNPWGLWVLFSCLATFFLFGWLVKENHSSVRARFAFIRFSFKTYALLNLTLYTLILLLMDAVTLIIFNYFLETPIDTSRIAATISFRFVINGLAFLFALKMKQIVTYYSLSLILTLMLALTGGAIIPIDGLTNRLPLLNNVHPLIPFLNGTFHNFWLYIVGVFIFIWYVRKDETYA